MENNSKYIKQNISNCAFKNKEKSDYFAKLKTTYPFDYRKHEESVENLVYKKGKLLIHEPFLMWFENLFEFKEKSFHNLLKHENSNIIDPAWKYYLAIMAVSTIKCEYLLHHLETEFLLAGGEMSWLVEGVKATPDKLNLISELNNILAHQPWKVEFKHIHTLLKNNWTKEELVEALLILVTYQKQATVIESLKFTFYEENDEIGQLSEILHFNNKENQKNSLFDCLESMNQSDIESEENGKFILIFNNIQTAKWISNRKSIMSYRILIFQVTILLLIILFLL